MFGTPRDPDNLRDQDEPQVDTLHPIIHAAGAGGRLPDWAVMSPARTRHVGRVGALMGEWADALGRAAVTRIRWRAAGLLHDALKDADPDVLRPLVDGWDAWPGALLHGPACANRLRTAGVDDEPLLRAISFHTTGHKDFETLGQALYMADFLEPGRRASARERARLRHRMPDDWHAVLIGVATAKIGTVIDRRIPVPRVTAGFWEAITAPH